MKGAVKTLFFLSIFIASAAHAKIFMCKDVSGRTLTSDRPIPECADRAVREYGNNGVLKRDIAAPLTAEQRRQKQVQEDRKKAELAAAEEQKKSDRALSARYRSEEDIATARKRDSDIVSEHIAQQKKSLAIADKDWKDAHAAVEAQKKKGAVPAGLQYKHDRSEKSVRELKIRLSESELELAQVHAKYDLIMQRFREITKTASAR